MRCRKMATKRKPISEYAWCVANDAQGVVFASFGRTRKEALAKFESHAGMTLQQVGLGYYVVKVYIATAKG
jgi:hypothetical protein